MASAELCEVKFNVDRWHVRAVSPLDISNGVAVHAERHPVLIHPGWAKAPERHIELMLDLEQAGFLPIGVDTRYGYADQYTQVTPASESLYKRLRKQSYAVGITNPYFDVDNQEQNRWEYRKPTSLLYLCERLGVVERSYVGHSDGARIVALAALGSFDQTRTVVVVNGAGTGDSSHGYSRMARANGNTIKRLVTERTEVPRMLKSALGSTAYALTHLRRTLKEKEVIERTDLWPLLDRLAALGILVWVLHASHDELISFMDSAAQAADRPFIGFSPTTGGHDNVYSPAVRDLIVEVVKTSRIFLLAGVAHPKTLDDPAIQ